MVELQMNNSTDQSSQVPSWLLITFTACTTLLVSVHMLALMISTCILPNVDEVAAMEGLVSESLHDTFSCIFNYFYLCFQVHESPHERMRVYIEIAWAFSTVFGIFLFLIELAILCWVKFWDIGLSTNKSGQKAALVATIMLIPIGIVFISFAVHFYTTLVSHKFERSEKNLIEVEKIANQLKNPETIPLKTFDSSDIENI